MQAHRQPGSLRARRSARVLTVAVAALLAITACGARVDSNLRKQAADAALSAGGTGGTTGGSTGSATGATATGSTGATSTGTTGATTTGTSGTTGTTGATGSTGATTGSTGATSTGTTGDNGGATDVGVTATSLTVGNVADLTGPVPGLFQAAPKGVQAYFAMINSQGGVNGRQLLVNSADSATDCTSNKNAHLNQLNKVFGWVGSFSLYDDCGTDVIEQHPTIPDVSYGLGKKTKANHTNNFPPQAAPFGYQNGMFCYWAHKYGDAVKHVGSIFPSIQSAADSQHYFEHSAQTCGWQWVYDQPEPATQNTFQTDIIRMQRRGVKLVFMAAENAANAAEFVNEAHQQNFNPIFIIPIAYASDFIDRLGGGDHGAGVKAAEGIVGSNLYSLFFNNSKNSVPNSDDAKNIAEVGTFQQWMARTNPGAALELYAMYGWCAAELFVQALKVVGPHVTRAKVTAALKKVHKFNCNGMLPLTDPGSHVPGNCYVIWHIHDGKYYRENTPANRFRCDGRFVPFSG